MRARRNILLVFFPCVCLLLGLSYFTSCPIILLPFSPQAPAFYFIVLQGLTPPAREALKATDAAQAAEDEAAAAKWTDDEDNLGICEAARAGDLPGVRGHVRRDPKAAQRANGFDGDTALHVAAGNGYEEICAVLLGAKASVEAKNHHGFTPLHFAATWGRLEVVRMLVAAKADVHAKDNDGDTPLKRAKLRDQSEVVEFLEKL